MVRVVHVVCGVCGACGACGVWCVWCVWCMWCVCCVCGVCGNPNVCPTLQLKKDIKIVSNVPTLSIEEATPIATNDRDILAPEEVQPKRKAYEQEDSELTSTDKKRKRRKWKKKAHFMSLKRAQREKLVTRLNPGLGNKYSKKAALKLLDKAGNAGAKDLIDKDGGKKVVKTSTQMFSQLQDMRMSKGSQLSHEERKKPRSSLKL